MVILLLFLFLPNIVYAEVKHLNITVDIQEDETVDFHVTWRFTDDIKEVILPVEGKVLDVSVEKGKCSLESNDEKLIVCKPPSPFMVGEITVKARFRVTDMIGKKGNVSYFSMDIPILVKTDNLIITVKLPKGMFISEDVLLPLSPSGAVSSIEERRIVESWYLKNMERGDIVPLRIYYEPITVVSPMEQVIMLIKSIKLLVGFIIILVTFFFLFLYRKAKEDRETIMSILNPDERLIVNLITNSGGKIVQRKLVDLSGFSKAKVSRIVSDLCERGLLAKERRGRKNIIKLRRRLKLTIRRE